MSARVVICSLAPLGWCRRHAAQVAAQSSSQLQHVSTNNALPDIRADLAASTITELATSESATSEQDAAPTIKSDGTPIFQRISRAKVRRAYRESRGDAALLEAIAKAPLPPSTNLKTREEIEAEERILFSNIVLEERSHDKGTDSAAQRLYAIYKEAQEAGNSREAFWKARQMVDNYARSGRMGVDTAIAVIELLSTTHKSWDKPIPVALQELVPKLGAVSQENATAYAAYACLLFRRAIAIDRQIWEGLSQDRGDLITRRSDPWRRVLWTLAPKSNRKKVEALQAENAKALADTGFRICETLYKANVDPTIDQLMTRQLVDEALAAGAQFARLDVVDAAVSKLKGAGLSITYKLYWRLMRCARSQHDMSVSDDLWRSYSALAKEQERVFSPTFAYQGLTLMSEAGRSDYEPRIWVEYIGCLIDAGRRDEALALLTDLLCQRGPPVDLQRLDKGWQTLLNPMLIFDAEHAASQHTVDFTVAAFAIPSIRTILSEARMGTFLARRIVSQSADQESYDHLQRLAIEVPQHCSLVPLEAAEAQSIVRMAIRKFFSRAYWPAETSEEMRELIRTAASIFARYASKFGIPLGLSLAERFADALSLIGQHDDALSIVRRSIRQELLDSTIRTDSEEWAPFRRRLQSAVEYALGFQIENAKPTLTQLLEGCSILFETQINVRRKMISPLLMQAVESTISKADPSTLAECTQGAHSATMFQLSRAHADPDTLPPMRLNIWSRAPGMEVPADDSLLTRKSRHLVMKMTGYNAQRRIRAQNVFHSFGKKRSASDVPA